VITCVIRDAIAAEVVVDEVDASGNRVRAGFDTGWECRASSDRRVEWLSHVAEGNLRVGRRLDER
jgi:hypothetical protein